MDRLIFSAVIAELPFGGFVIKSNFQCKFAESCFNIPGCGSIIACSYIAPVSLGLYQKIFLSHVYQCIADACITMWMILHGLPDDIGYFIEAAIIHFFHSMEDAALYRF